MNVLIDRRFLKEYGRFCLIYVETAFISGLSLKAVSKKLKVRYDLDILCFDWNKRC